MTKKTVKAGDLAKAKGGKNPPAAKAAPAKKEVIPAEEAKAATDEANQSEEVNSSTNSTSPTGDSRATDEVNDEKSKEAEAGDETEPANDKKAKASHIGKLPISEAKKQLEIMDKMRVDTLYRNPKGEYFTVENFAMLSVDGKRKNLLTITREMLQLIIKNSN